MPAKKPVQPLLTDTKQACPLRGTWVSFQLVDESGNGKPYAGLAYKLVDSTEQSHEGILDSEGFAKVCDYYEGPVILTVDSGYKGDDKLYKSLMTRPSYPLKITELQVRAETTRFIRKDGLRVENNPAKAKADQFFHVEVQHLVKIHAHLPPESKSKYPPNHNLLNLMGDLGFGQEKPGLWGVVLLPEKHTALEVRPLRSFRPMLSKDNKFSALNLYQLSLFASLSYCDFGQEPAEQPTDTVKFPLDPSVGYLFGNGLASFKEAWKINSAQTTPYYPLYEDVPYSKRFEVLPFDPTLYEKNKPELGEEQECPAKWHFFDDGKVKGGSDTQAFITHHDEVILISVRGTKELVDFVRDTDAEQVPFEEGVGKTHQGFYKAYKAMSKFVQVYLDQFHTGQKIIICGHSLGGAIATLLAEALRRSPNAYDILLYTYGSPRAGDADFVNGAVGLAHHRMVNSNDPIPSVPAPWMNTRKSIWMPGVVLSFVTAPLGALIFAIGLSRTGGAPYEHQGNLHHFMPVHFKGREQSAVLWDPGCDSIEEAACTKALKKFGDMPDRDAFVMQLFQMSDHYMVPSYIPYAWATLRRWQQTQESGTTVVTKTEYDQVYYQLQEMQERLKAKEAELRFAYQSDRRQYQQEANVLRAEIGRLDTSRQRIHTLSFLKLVPEDIYGSATQAPEHKINVDRWMAKKENSVEVQLAMIPDASSSDLRTA
ncbi:lipase [Pseudomonas sp. FSL W5-0299]|uniref:lipase family protein n=1 Tax=Pseudomonas sp. FSL W5-0299 TaxID=1917484 RepID=UPI00098B1D7E|nr:lipase [Pseudomonas sp. FSL W5-0299]MDF9880924.1 pimeloyl-ACP methyl ester carboxylesterase [Pseudomonas silensiensis]OOL38939.1 lipase [Pseudomonas sp. FSL W5-0299]